MQKYIIAGLAILAGILAFILWCRTPEVIHEVKTIEKRIIQKEYIKTSSVVTGATSITIFKDGTTTASGSNITIKSEAETKIITNTIEREKVVTEYKKDDWILSIDYAHIHADPDLLQLKISRRIIFDIYLTAGYNITVSPNILANPTYGFNPENWSLGISLLF